MIASSTQIIISNQKDEFVLHWAFLHSTNNFDLAEAEVHQYMEIHYPGATYTIHLNDGTYHRSYTKPMSRYGFSNILTYNN